MRERYDNLLRDVLVSVSHIYLARIDYLGIVIVHVVVRLVRSIRWCFVLWLVLVRIFHNRALGQVEVEVDWWSSG